MAKLKTYKLFGKDKGDKRFKFIAERKGRTKATVTRTFKMRSGWPVVKVKLKRR